jgi:hypothetical protein
MPDKTDYVGRTIFSPHSQNRSVPDLALIEARPRMGPSASYLGDVMLTQKLVLETNENASIKAANRFSDDPLPGH